MRLIDADALREEMQWSIDHGMYDKPYDYLAEIDDAPTVEPNGDTISRRAAILAITGEPPEAHYPSWYAERIKALPSAPDSRQRGEWVGCTGCEHYDQQQTRLICHECKRYYSDKYKGGEDE